MGRLDDSELSVRLTKVQGLISTSSALDTKASILAVINVGLLVLTTEESPQMEILKASQISLAIYTGIGILFSLGVAYTRHTKWPVVASELNQNIKQIKDFEENIDRINKTKEEWFTVAMVSTVLSISVTIVKIVIVL